MKNIYIKFLLLVLVAVIQGCELEEIPNPNAPTLDSFAEGASQADVQALAVGLEAVMRNDLDFHYETVSYLAREYYDLTRTDPRYTGEILKGPLDNNGFLTTRSFAAWYRVVKAANVLTTAVQNSSAGFSEEIKNSYYGYAKTIKAYAFLMLANRQYMNGIRLDVANPDNLGPFIGYDEALNEIRSLLDEAESNLLASPSGFDFTLSKGFDDLRKPNPSTPDEKLPLTTNDFIEFNRAIASRVALYQGDMPEVLELLQESFIDLNGAMSLGVAHIFGVGGNNISNSMFYELRKGNYYTVHASWINDAEPRDLRVTNKSTPLGETVSVDGLTGSDQFTLYKSNTDPVYLIRNEELILMYGEANIGINDGEAIIAINIVRNAAGLDSYSGGTTSDELIEEILKQRRYSLIGEGHRWVDLRRLGRLNPAYIPLDRTGDNIIEAFPTPFSENAN